MPRLAHRLALLLALGLALVAAPACAVDDGWLLGRWELVHSPEGDRKDWFEFAPAGRMTSIAPDGRRFGGRYAVTGREVEVNFKVDNQSVLLTLTYGPDRERLYARSGRTGNTAVYEKRP
ncbi:MAG TPA: hypothetical protein VLK35_22455 [Methylomirabilota bacterium]|nr:hypothetical protein [Methylomirabilota bacterium]